MATVTVTGSHLSGNFADLILSSLLTRSSGLTWCPQPAGRYSVPWRAGAAVLLLPSSESLLEGQRRGDANDVHIKRAPLSSARSQITGGGSCEQTCRGSRHTGRACEGPVLGSTDARCVGRSTALHHTLTLLHRLPCTCKYSDHSGALQWPCPPGCQAAGAPPTSRSSVRNRTTRPSHTLRRRHLHHVSNRPGAVCRAFSKVEPRGPSRSHGAGRHTRKRSARQRPAPIQRQTPRHLRLEPQHGALAQRRRPAARLQWCRAAG